MNVRRFKRNKAQLPLSGFLVTSCQRAELSEMFGQTVGEERQNCASTSCSAAGTVPQADGGGGGASGQLLKRKSESKVRTMGHFRAW
ncbi:hypothetical protein ZHAS_00010431 [Anopheles sinensis]|uniref:Uncharacterized protein n=1 Tax=Anopheles sinensis TaxID=74873 RepID=A0A084VXJ9_ANOSI|nr:hypothetical protein ZHAS_00010431 [Anopheles sinensis]